jgi:peptide/nickel transport system substrate-binding protein
MRLARGFLAMTMAATALVAMFSSACRQSDGVLGRDGVRPTLRVGAGFAATSSATEGLRTLAQLQTVENLARVTNDGRLQPWLAHDWSVSADGRSVSVNLVSGVKFHDGSPLTAEIVANAVRATLPVTMGPAFSDVESVSATDDRQIVIRLRRPSPFLLEALEVPVPKPGTSLIGTGPFKVDNPQSPTEMRANDDYYLGKPSIGRIVVANYPSVRAAWAEMLRGQLDMLYEVGADALDSLGASSKISTFTFVRRYQYAVVMNNQSDVFRSKAFRQAVNYAIDRQAIVRDGLNGHGVVSTGPVWPYHYAFKPGLAQFRYDVKRASQLLSDTPRPAAVRHFRCLVRPDAAIERIALILKHQLQQVGIEMSIEELPIDKQIAAIKSGQFDAALSEIVSGPTLLRPYQLWHSGGFFNFKSASIDAALDDVRHSASEDAYLKAVAGLQQAMLDDPPAIFLAWSERARAVSKRFEVPPVEAGRDILANVRLWKSSGLPQEASRN